MNTDPHPAPPDEPDPALGEVIRRLREEKKLSQSDLAERSQVTLAALSGIERGAIDPPWPTVERIARGLGVSMQKIASEVVERERAEETS